MRPRCALLLALFALGAVAIANAPAMAGLTPYDAPTLTCVGAGENEITLKICAGLGTSIPLTQAGAPAGFTVQWKKLSDYEISGWADDGTLCALSLSGQPSLKHPDASRWELWAGECEEIDIGDINFDETGVSGTGCALDVLECGTEYVFRAFAHAGRSYGRSAWSANVVCPTADCPPEDCTWTQGKWKTHGPVGCLTGNNVNVWPVTSLTLGTVNYTDAQLCSIFNTPAGGNCLLSLAHQLIAAKFNVLIGAECPGATTLITQADVLISNKVLPGAEVRGNACNQGNPSINKVQKALDDFNNGRLAGCPPHCASRPAAQPAGATPVQKSTWGKLKVLYR